MYYDLDKGPALDFINNDLEFQFRYNIDNIVAILGVSRNGIDYNANDGLLCNFILLILDIACGPSCTFKKYPTP